MNTIDELREYIDGMCTYPEGYNPSCVDCTECHRKFLAMAQKILDGGGTVRAIVFSKERNEIHELSSH